MTQVIDSPEKARWIKKSVLSYLLGNAVASIVPTILAVVVFAWINIEQVKTSVLCLSWVLFGVGLSIVRLLHYRLYKKENDRFSVIQWLNSYRFLTFLSGVTYGLTTVLFFQNASPTLQVFNMFLVIGVPAAGIGTHSVDTLTYRLFMLAITVPSALVLMTLGDTAYFGVGGLIILFIWIMDRTARKSAAVLRSNFEMTYAMKYRATHDALVGLFNRVELENKFESLVSCSTRSIAMIFIDLDNFKPLNDSLGHQAGDEALKKVANIIKQSIRSDDVAARLGGDEFVVLLLLDSEQEAIHIAEVILAKINNISIDQYEGVGASIGIAFHHNTDVGFSNLMRVADIACYQSKHTGRNKVTLKHYED